MFLNDCDENIYIFNTGTLKMCPPMLLYQQHWNSMIFCVQEN